MNNQWYVITGGPSTGKSTLLKELESLGYTTLPEAARTVIDRAIATGKTVNELRANEAKFQLDVLKHKQEIERDHARDTLTFFDRGMHDTLAYLELINEKIDNAVIDAVKKSKYKKVFLLDPLSIYESDYARTETQEEALKLNALLHKAFSDYGMEPVKVPALSPSERAQFVLQHID